MRSSPATCAESTFGGVKNVSPRFLELVAVTPGTSAKLVRATLGMAELLGSGAFTAMSAAPPPGARPRFVGLPTLLTHPPPVNQQTAHLSAWPPDVNGKHTLPVDGPSSG